MLKPITAITHPLTDIIISCSPDFLVSEGLQPGSYAMLSEGEQDALLKRCSAFPSAALAGGSAANSVQTARIIGVPAAVVGLAGEDAYGQKMCCDLEEQGVNVPLARVPNARTGTCVSLITPDGERTMRTCLGVARDLDSSHITAELVANSSWLLVEGYFLTASESNTRALLEAIKVARSNQVKIAFAVAAEFVIAAKLQEIQSEVLPHVDLLIANEGEARALTQTALPQEALKLLLDRVESAVITCAKDGALCGSSHSTWHTPAFSSTKEIVDTTGAGDVFAGALLAGLAHGLTPVLAAQGAARLAGEVVTQVGARLPTAARVLWERATAER
jgi:sugar/nucleoside kinase (ribokinase family)